MAPTSSTTSWLSLPAEIQNMILEALLQIDCKLAHLATVSQEWQQAIERRNFSRLVLTPSCLAQFARKTIRRRPLVGYIWFCLEIQPTLEDYDHGLVSPGDANQIASGIKHLFSILSMWEPSGELILDISIYSRTDPEYHYHKEYAFKPDVPPNGCSSAASMYQLLKAKVIDRGPREIWDHPDCHDTRKSLGLLAAEDILFDNGEREARWWRQLPKVPAVTGILLRQQTRRQWSPVTLSHMFSRLPRLWDIRYEPWRDWYPGESFYGVAGHELFFKSIQVSTNIRKLVMFENLHPYGFSHDSRPGREIQAISQMAAKACLGLEQFFGSFIVDASGFFSARKPSWEWTNLETLILTSQLLTPRTPRTDIRNMLKQAAAAAMAMPRLKTMEIWNGQAGLATLFKYQPNRGQTNAIITWRSTWECALQPVAQAWRTAAYTHGARGLVIYEEPLEAAPGSIGFYGDAICDLHLSQPVIRPVSLQQILMDQLIVDIGIHWELGFFSDGSSPIDPDNKDHQQILARLGTN